ncbi:putative FMN-binding regulatory protein PaiB [Geomicrobium halophilum]|uniref:Putative FMN-binding regulatory protein PaiB n=1 Tax=Geomicrobium halophilum TaxID=549000 RepID=A0A841PZN0_9BACL|nr:putative FMN-binding regulatory protein PaiB [Geomicrobium halophilum]
MKVPIAHINWMKSILNILKARPRGVAGFKIKVDKIEGKAKLVKTTRGERQKLVIHALEKSEHEDEQKIASDMKKNLEADV